MTEHHKTYSDVRRIKLKLCSSNNFNKLNEQQRNSIKPNTQAII